MSPSPRRARLHSGIGACLVPVLLASSLSALTGCGGGQAVPPPAVAGAAMANDPPPSPDAVRVRFQAEQGGERWSLLTADGKPVCDFPCERWVTPNSGMSIERERPGYTRVDLIGVPADFRAPAGATVDAVARRPHETRRLGTAFVLFAISAAILGVVGFGVADNRTQTSGPIEIGVAVGVTGVLLGTGLYLRSVSHPMDLVTRPVSPPAHPSVALGPGFVEGTTGASSGVHFVLTPLGAVGTF